jgi:uptake hydrogenase large subunit
MNPPAIRIELAPDGARGAHVAITPRQLPDLSPLLRGRASRTAPARIGLLFSLCAESQRIAAEYAVAAAQRRPIDMRVRRRGLITLHAERIAEHLRSSLLDWPGADESERQRYVAPLRTALAAARRVALADADAAAPSAALEGAILAMGASAEAPRLWFRRLAEEAEAADAPLDGAGADYLTVADAQAVARALCDHPRQFARRPRLPGRRVETGPTARHAAQLKSVAGSCSRRLRARLFDIEESLAALRALEAGDESETLVSAFSPAPGEGFALVESPRGLLCHHVALGDNDAILGYDVIAPTEWNFHPEGPAARALSRLDPAGANARLRAARLAALHDPCAPVDLHIREAQHA